MPEPYDIRQLVTLPPEDAIAFLDAKGYRTSVNWTETWQDEHASAFTVAKVAKVDLLREIHVSLLDAMAKGETFESWKAGLQPKLEAAGWWGRVTDPDLTGTDRTVIVGPRRLRTIYDTNLRMARATALWGRIWAGREAMPFLRYSAVMDRRTRPQHRAWHDIVLPVEHPFWQSHFPPNGWNCRCTVTQLSQRTLERRGLAITTEAELTRRGFGSAPVPFFRKGAAAPELVPRGIDPGFAYNPGTARARLVLENAAASLARAAGVPGLLEPALDEITGTLPGGRPDRARLDAMAALARAGQIAELATLLAELLGVATVAAGSEDVETAARGGKRGGRKSAGKGGLTEVGRESLRRHAKERRGALGRFEKGAARQDIERMMMQTARERSDNSGRLTIGRVDRPDLPAIDGLNITLRSDRLRHILNRHGPGSRDRFPISASDLEAVPRRFNAASVVNRGEPSAVGNQTWWVDHFEAGFRHRIVLERISNRRLDALVPLSVLKRPM